MRLSRELLFSPETQKLELLKTPIKDLPFSLNDGILGQSITTTAGDLERMGIRRLQPNYYLSTGYGVVGGTTNVAVSLFDTNELLRELEGEFLSMYTAEEVLMTVRHEVGHAFCYAYKLYRRDDFRKTFNVRGNYLNTYPLTNRYVERANPWSRDFVNPSGDHYAQKHPDDDWAETFMLVITPGSDWRRAYRDRPGALAKLEFVDWMIKQLGDQPPVLVNRADWLDDPVEEVEKTVARFLRARIGKYRRRATGYVDPDLKKLFPAHPTSRQETASLLPAASFLAGSTEQLAARVAQWSGVDQIVVRDLLEKCTLRAQALKLALPADVQEQTLLSLTACLTMRCCNFANTGRFF